MPPTLQINDTDQEELLALSDEGLFVVRLRRNMLPADVVA